MWPVEGSRSSTEVLVLIERKFYSLRDGAHYIYKVLHVIQVDFGECLQQPLTNQGRGQPCRNDPIFKGK